MPAGFGDYTLTSYVVQCDRAEIRLRAREPHSDTPKETEIIFHGVAAYHFENDNFGTILGWIIEHPLREFIAEHAEQFARGSKSSGWPLFWNGSADDAFRELQAASIHAFEVASCGYGMDGWVLAREYETRAVMPPVV
jgi:hypothetical protein